MREPDIEVKKARVAAEKRERQEADRMYRARQESIARLWGWFLGVKLKQGKRP